MIELPPCFRDIVYRAECYPGAEGISGVANGANCQQFAYELLRHLGKRFPDFRSSDLWDDANWTITVTSFEPLDLLLYHSEPRAWGAHVGVYLGDSRIVHLSKELTRPAIWSHEEFLATPRYRCFIGAKRVRDGNA